MNNHIKKFLAVLITLSLMLPIGLFGVSAAGKTNDVTGTHDYTIVSPYKDVNWNTWEA